MKQQFIDIYKKNIRRPGADKLLTWLEGTDFFVAPASTKYNLNREGGLCEHSVHVYHRLRRLYLDEYCKEREIIPQEEEMIAVIALLHDLCKTNFYKQEPRNRKNAAGEWEKYMAYTIDDELPLGHGEKSVILIQFFMRLRMDETLAIRWHMGFSDATFKGGSQDVSNAFGKCPVAVLLHIADLQATYLDEKE